MIVMKRQDTSSFLLFPVPKINSKYFSSLDKKKQTTLPLIYKIKKALKLLLFKYNK